MFDDNDTQGHCNKPEVYRTTIDQKKVTIYTTNRINTGGNNCGHDPLNPILALPKPAKKGPGGIPRILTLCAERITRYYYQPRKTIPSLDLANGSQRQQRSERRESCIRLMAALLKRVDLCSLRVGVPTADGFMSYTVDYIVTDTGMGQKRVERAMADLKRAGIVTVTQRCKQLPSGEYRGLAAIKTVSRHLFGMFGLSKMLKKERDKASRRLKEKMATWEKARDKATSTLTAKARTALFLSAILQQFNKPANAEKAKAIEYQKRLQALAVQFKQKNPNWDSKKCFYEAEQALGGL